MLSFKTCLTALAAFAALPSIALAGEPLAADSTATASVPTAEAPAETQKDPMDPAEVASRFGVMDAQLKASQSQIDGLKKKDEEKDRRIALLEDKVESIEESGRYHSGGVGIGISFPTGGGGGGALAVTGNLKWLSAYYYVARGGGLALNVPITIGRVTIRPFGLGFMYYQDDADTFSSRWLRRNVDLVLPVGVDVRVWRSLQATLQATWFLPNPVTAASAGSDSSKASAQQLDPNFADKAGDVIGNAYGDAIKAPRIELIAKWVF